MESFHSTFGYPGSGTLSLHLLIASLLITSSDIIFYTPLKISSSVSEVDIPCCHQQYILNFSLKLIEPLFSVRHIDTFT